LIDSDIFYWLLLFWFFILYLVVFVGFIVGGIKTDTQQGAFENLLYRVNNQ